MLFALFGLVLDSGRLVDDLPEILAPGLATLLIDVCKVVLAQIEFVPFLKHIRIVLGTAEPELVEELG